MVANVRRTTPGTRLLVRGLALALVTGGACTGSPAIPEGSRTLEAMARDLGSDVVTFLRRGHIPDRSGEIVLVAKPRNVVVRRGSWIPGEEPPSDTSHSSPWDFHQRVPIVLWGPGHVPAGVRSDDPVDLADLPPTFGRLMGFPFPAPSGEPLADAIGPPVGGRSPRAIVLVVFDGGGWNLLEEYPDAWPVVRDLMAGGTTYTNATVGSSPSVTAAAHATMGTGAYPELHGIPDNTARLPDGTVGDPWFGRSDPGLLRLPTLADAWDSARDNEPWAGLVATESWHVGMLGRGAAAEGADRDVAVLWNRGKRRWFTNPDAYHLPGYLPRESGLARRVRELDGSDGAIDGRWLGNDLEDANVLPGTPAFVDHQGQALLDVVREEPIGRDEITDLLFVEMKSTDRGAHVWNMYGEEEPLVLAAQDALVGRLIEALDARVGRGRYVLALTADHGLTPLPEKVGGLRIHPDAVGRRVEERFGEGIVEAVTPAGLFLRRAALSEGEVPPEDVARFIADLRYADGLPDGVDVDRIPPALRDRRVFAGVFPGAWLRGLTPAQVAALGPGRYPEGSLLVPPVLDL